MLAACPGDHFGWIYLDADHSNAGTRRQAVAAAAKVKAGGYLVFNDFAHGDPDLGAYGVPRAVADFVPKQNWPFAWFAYGGNAHYDVALKRPLAAASA